MSLPTHPLLSLVESNRNGLKSMLTYYIDATVDSHYNAMKQNIVEMIQSGLIGTQQSQSVSSFGTLPPPTQANTDLSSAEGLNEYSNGQLTIAQEHHNTQQNEVPLANTINTDEQMIKQEFDDDDDYATNCEKCIKGICNSVCENNDNTSGDNAENENEPFDEPNDCAELKNNQTNQSIVSNDILPSHVNSINIEPTQIKQECHQGSSITSILLDVNNNAALNDISIDEQIEGQNIQFQTDTEFENIDEYTYDDYCKDREYLNNPDCEDCANGDCDLDHENNNNHLNNDVSVGDGENEVSNTQSFPSTENHMTNIETDQKDRSVNIERNSPPQLTPSTSTGIRSSTRKRIPKKVFGFDDQSNDDNVKRRKNSVQSNVKKVKPRNIEQENDDDNQYAKSQVVVLELYCTEPGCGQTATSRALWREHMRNDHHKSPYHQVETNVQINNLNTTKIVCPSTNCTGVYNSHSSFLNHWSYYHHPGQYLCPSCPFTANLHCKVQNHLNTSHGPLVCSHEHCGKNFAKMSELKRHELTHSKDHEKQYKCTWTSCSRLRFKLLEGAVRHVMVKHLTKSPNKQNDANIIESRDPHKYIRKITK